MIAKVNYSDKISRCFSYGENPKKGGEIILQQGVFEHHSPEQKAVDWERISNNYKHRVVHVIISLGPELSAQLKAINDSEQRLQYEQRAILEFLGIMSEKGNNIQDCPFVCYHHGNTDNEHVHMYVLMTAMDGLRLKTKLIGKNADRAAARYSLLHNQKGAPKAMRAELRHCIRTGKLQPSDISPEMMQWLYAKPEKETAERIKRTHVMTGTAEEIAARTRRADAVEAAKRRKTKCRAIITEVAGQAHDAASFTSKLKGMGLEFFISPDKGFSVRFTDEIGKERDYSFKQLDLSEDMVPYMKPIIEEDETKRKECEKVITTGKHVARAARGHSQSSMAKTSGRIVNAGSRAAHVLSQQSGGSDENREYEVGDHEGYEESIRRENGLNR